MSTDRAVRQVAERLKTLGVSQVAIGRRIGRTAGWVSRWIHQTKEEGKRPPVINADQIDAFWAYVAEIRRAIPAHVDQREMNQEDLYNQTLAAVSNERAHRLASGHATSRPIDKPSRRRR